MYHGSEVAVTVVVVVAALLVSLSSLIAVPESTIALKVYCPATGLHVNVTVVLAPAARLLTVDVPTETSLARSSTVNCPALAVPMLLTVTVIWY